MSKLYIVEYTVTAVVQADDEANALRVAMNEKREAMNDGFETVDVIGEVKDEDDLVRIGWDVRCLPYGGDGCTRIREILAAAAQTEQGGVE